MITRVELFSEQPDAPELPLGGFIPNDDPVQILDIDGLGPVKAEITTSQFATERGEAFQGASTGKRNIVLTLGLNPNWVDQTMTSLRQLLYRYLLPEAWVKLRFFSQELPTIDIEGWVESCDPNIFSQDPQMQVSIICPKPDFVEPDATIYTGVVDNGTIETEFEYIGTVAAGFELRVDRAPARLNYTGALDIQMKSPVNPQVFHVDPVTIDNTKYFKLSTRRSAKRVETISLIDGSTNNLFSYLSNSSVWPVIKPGKNVFSIAAAQPGQEWTLAYFNRFGGL